MTGPSHGARPVPINLGPAPSWTTLGSDAIGEHGLRAAADPPRVPRLPDDHREVIEMALGPLRQWATVPIVGVEGGAGRTTVARLLGRAFATIRKDYVVAVDAVPLWGGLTACVADSNMRGLTVQDIADMDWPPRTPINRILRDEMNADGPLPIVKSHFASQPAVAEPDVIDLAVRRLSALADLTLVDTVADPLSSPVRKLILANRTAPVWVCTASRDGLWRVSQAIAYFENLGAENLAARSVVAVVGHERRWSSDAAAAETQLTGGGLEIIRVPCGRNALVDRHCSKASVLMLAAVAARLECWL